MIIWINGTFGSGKTTTAYELHKRVKNSFVYDPERFGFVLMANVPAEISKGDFQDYPLWREANYSLLKQIAIEYKGTIIVPMTLTNEQYFTDIIGRLRDIGIEIKHYTLTASKTTIQKRLRTRFEGKNSWAYQQIEGRVASLSKDRFKEHIQTDQMSIDEVVETIARLSGIELMPDYRTKFQKGFERLAIKLKEISIFK
ncbi:AAA family ATPase [Ferdinandcohnia quinoae]|uniref:AAA family ATPase n=1 Tax=Fredinandcohnia quinoae TaxID=2918902 RepID=A0AAW5DYS1_9BACI|nr:AAA family ATPase [Fredinandcohnia sp. SECRCQ15]MCH1625228.1 AAA family ATPase [Fredinandcohnia sp. SECRCQ15]